MDRQVILDEIRRTAEENGGVPFGKLRLDKEAGIKEHHWKRYWPRLSDAQREAGFDPNAWTGPIDRKRLLELLAGLARELGHFPTHAELMVRSNADKAWPNQKVFSNRLGAKAEMVESLAAFCRESGGLDDVLAYCQAVIAMQNKTNASRTASDADSDGFVYLLKSGRFYKIGKTNHAGKRERELALQLPERASMVHSIKTDDPDGIERYWHQRFADKRKNGEWFDLDRQDVAAFRRRRFM